MADGRDPCRHTTELLDGFLKRLEDLACPAIFQHPAYVRFATQGSSPLRLHSSAEQNCSHDDGTAARRLLSILMEVACDASLGNQLLNLGTRSLPTLQNEGNAEF